MPLELDTTGEIQRKVTAILPDGSVTTDQKVSQQLLSLNGEDIVLELSLDPLEIEEPRTVGKRVEHADRNEIRDGVADLHSTYRFELSATNRIVSVTNTSFGLRALKLAEAGKDSNLVELSEFAVNGGLEM